MRDSHVLKVLDEDTVTGGYITVSGNQIRYIANNGSYVFIDFQRSIADLLKGDSSAVTVRTRP